MGETGRKLACPECSKPCLWGSKFCAHCGTLLSRFGDHDGGHDGGHDGDDDGDGALPPGTLVGRYRVLGVLSEGGMGRVYVAEHVKLGRRVAIKKLRRELVSNRSAVSRFFAEARAVNRIFHENIVEIADVIEQPGGDNCIIMELLKGEDLAHRLQRARTLPLVRAFSIAGQIASALAAVHAAGMMHRDLRPDHIFLIERAGNPDFVKVLDFGVARLSGADDRAGSAMHSAAAGQIIGTPEYISPEQARGDHIDFRADIYTLGVIIYEMITGALPFQAKSFGELMMLHMTAPVELPSKQPGLRPAIQIGRDQLLLDLLAKDPADRPESMADVERRLRELVDAMMRSESTRPSALSRPSTDAVAKLALVKRSTPPAAVEIAPPRSVSRIDVLTPSSIRLDLIARPVLRQLAVDQPPPAVALSMPSADRLAKSSSDAHWLAEPTATGASDGAERSRAEPGRGASPSSVTGPGVSASRESSNPVNPVNPVNPANREAAMPARARRRLVLGAAVVVALAGVGVAFELGRPLPTAPAGAAHPPEVRIKFVSAPPGAEVRLAGTDEPLGVTPFSRSFPRSDRSATFELAKPGFETVTQDIALAGDDAVAVALTPVIAAPATPPREP